MSAAQASDERGVAGAQRPSTFHVPMRMREYAHIATARPERRARQQVADSGAGDVRSTMVEPSNLLGERSPGRICVREQLAFRDRVNGTWPLLVEQAPRYRPLTSTGSGT